MEVDRGQSQVPAAAPSTTQSNLKGILWMLAYTSLISGMHVSVRWVSEGLHPFEIAFFRNLFALVVVVPWFVRLGWAPLRTGRLGLLVTRGVLNTFCMLAFFTGLSLIPLAEATALTFTSPIFATLMAVFVFREVVGPRRWIAIGVGLAGVFVILRPGFESIQFGQVLVLCSALCWSVCVIIVKGLGRTESAVTITTYMSLVMAPMSLLPALFVWTWPTWPQLAALVLIGALGGAGQMAMSQSLRLADTHVVTPMDFTRLLFVSVLAYLFFGQVPDAFVWIGGAMILSSIAFIAYREHAQRQRARGGAAA
ncbi:MAG: DMT family transporter [Hyphomicrobiales bacterium]|nr:DMT family transporter [Hyphomicrobiales bacterium]